MTGQALGGVPIHIASRLPERHRLERGRRNLLQRPGQRSLQRLGVASSDGRSQVIVSISTSSNIAEVSHSSSNSRTVFVGQVLGTESMKLNLSGLSEAYCKPRT